MEQNIDYQLTSQQPPQGSGLQEVPSSTAVLVLGIVSIVTCFCYGLPGIVTGIIALVLASKGKKLYNENPPAYNLVSYKNLKAGSVCAIVGLSLSALYLVVVVIYIIALGTIGFNLFNMLKDLQ